MTLREGVEVSRPPCKRCHLWSCRESLPVNQKRWGRDPRHEIDAWIRSREVKEALPQQASVLELGRTYNALFLHKIEASTKISCTF